MKKNGPFLPLDPQGFPFSGEVNEINESIWFIDNDGFRLVGCSWGKPLYRFSLENKTELRYVAVSLRLGGFARQEEIACAFGVSVRSLIRWEKRYLKEGMEGLFRKMGAGRPRKVKETQERYIRKWFKEGATKMEIGRRLGVDEGTIRNTLKRLGLHRETLVIKNQELFSEEEGGNEGSGEEHGKAEEKEEEGEEGKESGNKPEEMGAKGKEPVEKGDPVGFVSDPTDRSLDRILAALGHLEDAKPAFAEVDHLPRAGVLLAVPLFVQTGILEVFKRVYESIGPAFYGLRTTVLCLYILALLRIKRPENLKEHNPQDLGRLLGLDRAPEVKTLRRKLDRLASFGKGLLLMNYLAKLRAQEQPEGLGFLYMDGHVKEYHGKYKTGKAFISRRRLAAPGATDTWVNDLNGEPFFVVQSELNEGLTKTLEPILTEVRKLVGPKRSITVVFDRGGWSPKLFTRLIQSGYHLITYRRGHFRKIAHSCFQERKFIKGGKTFIYELHDAVKVRVGKTGNTKSEGPKYLWMRQVTRLRDGKWQTAVITDRMDLPPEKILYLMFNRWRQENFFKYMRDEFELDALLKYGCDPVGEEHNRPNPEIKKTEKELCKARGELKDAERALGILLRENEESNRRTVRGFKIANSKALRRMEEAMRKVNELKAKKAKLPKRVSAEGIFKLKRERDLIADSIKMCAYQVESKLREMLNGSFSRNEDEGRTLLHAAFQSAGRIEVSNDELKITLEPQSSPHRSSAVAALCKKLNLTRTKFPGTDLRLSYAVDLPKPDIS